MIGARTEYGTSHKQVRHGSCLFVIGRSKATRIFRQNLQTMADSNTTGDFKDKQFEKEEVADKVVEQYDEERARVFYKHVMVRRT